MMQSFNFNSSVKTQHSLTVIYSPTLTLRGEWISLTCTMSICVVDGTAPGE